MARLLGLLPLALPSVLGVTFDCEHQRVSGISFDLSPLGGPHSVSWIVSEPPSVANTTFTIDICRPLRPSPDLKKEEQCPTGTRVCAVERDHNGVEDTDSVKKVVPIAGDFASTNGRALDPKVTRLKNSASNGDAEKEGLRVEFNGGKYPDTKSGRVQRAVVEFECDKSRTGNEDLGEVGKGRMVRRRGEEDGGKDGEDKDGKDEEEDRSLRFVSYKAEGDDIDVLRLNWRTKYACEEVEDDDRGKASGGWGFFSLLFLLIFLGAAGYILFGSWLNYSRYGARGWDLLPHGDAIRDLPYIFKDWIRSVMDTVQGRGYRGGYSAV